MPYPRKTFLLSLFFFGLAETPDIFLIFSKVFALNASMVNYTYFMVSQFVFPNDTAYSTFSNKDLPFLASYSGLFL